MSDVTEFSQVAFDKRFKFLADMEQNEKKILSKKLRKVKDKELKGNIHKLINRLVLKVHFKVHSDLNLEFRFIRYLITCFLHVRMVPSP